MDCKYIEQLIEKYWECSTTLEEERILRLFFRQEHIPAHLLRYKALFVCLENEKKVGTDAGFEARVLAGAEQPAVKAARLTLYRRLLPVGRAAALIVAIFSVCALLKESGTADVVQPAQVPVALQSTSDGPQVACETSVPVDSAKLKALPDKRNGQDMN